MGLRLCNMRTDDLDSNRIESNLISYPTGSKKDFPESSTGKLLSEYQSLSYLRIDQPSVY